MKKLEMGKFLADTYYICDKDVHEWSSSQSIGTLTVIVWSITFILLRYGVFA